MLPNRSIKYSSSRKNTFACIIIIIIIMLNLSRSEKTFDSISGSIRNYAYAVSCAEL